MRIHSLKIKNKLFIIIPHILQIFASVQLKVEQKEIKLGKPLKLSCEFLSGEVTGSRRWYGGKDVGLLCLNGVSSNPTKYHESKIGSRKYELNIEKVSESDLNCPYACRYGFQSGQRIMTVNETNFKYIPTDDLTDVKYTKEDRIYAIGVTFDKVFPVPSCAVITKSKRKPLTIVDLKRNGIFYAVQFSDQSEEPFHSCDSPVEIECDINHEKYNISQPHTLECDDAVPMLPIVLISMSVVLLLLALIFVIIRIKRNRSKISGPHGKDKDDVETTRPLA